jgi:hypothetical protein
MLVCFVLSCVEDLWVSINKNQRWRAILGGTYKCSLSFLGGVVRNQTHACGWLPRVERERVKTPFWRQCQWQRRLRGAVTFLGNVVMIPCSTVSIDAFGLGVLNELRSSCNARRLRAKLCSLVLHGALVDLLSRMLSLLCYICRRCVCVVCYSCSRCVCIFVSYCFVFLVSMKNGLDRLKARGSGPKKKSERKLSLLKKRGSLAHSSIQYVKNWPVFVCSVTFSRICFSTSCS